MQDLGYELPRIHIPRTPVNKESKGLKRIPLDDQGEAEAVVVSVVVGTLFSIVFSTVTVRAGGGAACSRLPPMRPRRNPTSSPTSRPTASAATAALASATFLLTGLALLLPIVLPLHPCRVLTLAWLLGAPEKRLPHGEGLHEDTQHATLRASYATKPVYALPLRA
jgi:hypothetical protein